MEAGRSVVQGQPGLHEPCLKKQKRKVGERMGGKEEERKKDLFKGTMKHSPFHPHPSRIILICEQTSYLSSDCLGPTTSILVTELMEMYHNTSLEFAN